MPVSNMNTMQPNLICNATASTAPVKHRDDEKEYTLKAMTRVAQ
jgi:hypothetical protein